MRLFDSELELALLILAEVGWYLLLVGHDLHRVADADRGLMVLIILAALFGAVERMVATWLDGLVLLVVRLEVVQLGDGLLSLDGLVLLLGVRIAHRLLGLSRFNTRSLLLVLGLLRLVQLAEVEKGDVHLVRRRHRPLPVVHHALFSSFLLLGLAAFFMVVVLKAVSLNRSRVIMDLAHLVHRLVLVLARATTVVA